MTWLSDKLSFYAATGVALVLAATALSQCGATKAQRDRAERAEGLARQETQKLWTCSGNVTALENGIKDRNSEIDRLAQEFKGKLEASGKAADGYKRQAATSEAKARKLLSTPLSGLDQCARMLEADDAVIQALK